jgi:hypothetical protein
MTRYGKTLFVAIGLLLLICCSPIELHPKVKRIVIIAPTIEQTRILRGYINELITRNTPLNSLLDKSNSGSPKRLRAEQSKQRITFKNGWEIVTLTAHAGDNEENPAPNLMGWGGDIIVIDEACLIRQEVYTSRISRMLGDNPTDSKLIIIANPWHKHSFVYQAWNNPAFTKIKVDWHQALVEGRTFQAYLDEQKANLSSYEWTVLYESDFADESEDTLIRGDWIRRAVERGKTPNDSTLPFTGMVRVCYGLDVAEQGVDRTVLTTARTDGTYYRITSQEWIHNQETMPCANEVAALISKKDPIQVDSIGIGAGVHSRLKELGFNAVSIRVSETPTQEKERFLNQKSQRYWHLRTLFENDKISIPDNPTLTTQLTQIRYKITPTGKIQIIDPHKKSPDYTDSLMLTLQTQKTELPFMFAT